MFSIFASLQSYIPIKQKPKILIIGYPGIISQIVYDNLNKHDRKFRVELVSKSVNEIKKHTDAVGIIIAGCDKNIIIKTLYDIGSCFKEPVPIMIKGKTITEDVETYPKYVTISPEFVRIDSAADDFQYQEFLVLGGDDDMSDFWADVFSHLPNANLVYVSKHQASSISDNFVEVMQSCLKTIALVASRTD